MYVFILTADHVSVMLKDSSCIKGIVCSIDDKLNLVLSNAVIRRGKEDKKEDSIFIRGSEVICISKLVADRRSSKKTIEKREFQSRYLRR